MEFSLTIIFLLISLGFLSGFVSVIAGVGGGVFFVSIMTLLFLIPIDTAVSTSTFIILFSSLTGFISYLKQKRTNFKLSILFSVFSIIGSIIASVIFSFIHIESSLLKILFAYTLLIAGVNMIYKILKKLNNNKNEIETHKLNFSFQDHKDQSNLKKSIPLFLLAGFTAYLLGLGGGIINTPALNLILNYPIHNSTAISTSIIFFTAIYNTIIKICLGQIDYLVGLFIAIGSILGSFFGAKISKKISRIHLQIIVAIVLMSLAIRMFF
ncbi:MAG: sulfite exporter TauE/SafE family protein [Promethearchaeota archaeon]